MKHALPYREQLMIWHISMIFIVNMPLHTKWAAKWAIRSGSMHRILHLTHKETGSQVARTLHS